eukprot:TRINITY_DN13157_c0_g1_i1.p1 TRINITY_DN13157_c0_g1~~TRINITY_DN13157_c0_g1_i1.p1  ORF type:complete len:571 (+),score=178.41 TRINITY_DN13157_c0_g1_i1:42-1754(+)
MPPKRKTSPFRDASSSSPNRNATEEEEEKTKKKTKSRSSDVLDSSNDDDLIDLSSPPPSSPSKSSSRTSSKGKEKDEDDGDEEPKRDKGKEKRKQFDDSSSESDEEYKKTKKKKAKQQEVEEESDDDSSKPHCKYGSNCYRSNPDHRKEYYHPKKSSSSSSPTKSPSKSSSSTSSSSSSSSTSKLPNHKAKPGVWSDIGSLYILDSGINSEKIAAFDLDHTLIKPKGNTKFPKGRTDWKWMFGNVPKKLKELHNDDYKIVIFTNQGGVAKGKQKPGELTGKISDMQKELGIPLQAFMATGNDQYRKPASTMWHFLLQNCNGGVEVNMKKSFYCGDAAGRPREWSPGASKDFNCSDRAFAWNIKVKFQTPEEFFLGWAPAKFHWDSIDPQEYLDKLEKEGKDIKIKTLPKGKQEMVILVGPPASGKSTFFRKYFSENSNYVHINMDTLKSKDKCLKTAQSCLQDGKSVVIDNTNPAAATRKEYLKLRPHGVSARCFVISTSMELVSHLNSFRERVSGVKRIPSVAYNMYRSKFDKPSKSEGFEEVTEVPFIPHFKNDQQRAWFLERTSKDK